VFNVANQVDSLIMVTPKLPAWWADALPITPHHTTMGNELSKGDIAHAFEFVVQSMVLYQFFSPKPVF